MIPSRVDDLYSRRGSVLLWERALPPDPTEVDRFTGSLRQHAFSAPKKTGPMGERYSVPYKVLGYLQSKITTVFTEVYGTVDDRTMQITLPALRLNNTSRGIYPLPKDAQDAYDAGSFVHFNRGTTLARDRFKFLGMFWIVKAAAVPIVDLNRTLAWRILVAADTL